MKKVFVATLGCRTNQYESQLFLDQLRGIGYLPVNEEEEVVDLCIVNTCTVTDHADSSSRNQIRGLLKRYPEARFFVTGCMVGSAPEAIRAIDPRIEVIPNEKKKELITLIDASKKDVLNTQIQTFQGHTRAFVKVQDGCNSFCTYCIVPYVRGRSVSRPVAEVVSEVTALVKNGYQEVVLTGINIGDYVTDEGTLVDLVRSVDRVEGLKRFRISSIDPNAVGERLITALVESRSGCPNLHLSLQSGSDRVLKRMNRKYTRALFLETVAQLQQAMPDFTVTTDVIVGFPGETEEDFKETLEVVSSVRFAHVHVFPYSPRQRTRAALFPNRVPVEVVQARKAELARLCDEVAVRVRSQFVGRVMDVLIEEGGEQGLLGYTNNFLRVQIPKGTCVPNQLVPILLSENEEGLLKGKPV